MQAREGIDALQQAAKALAEGLPAIFPTDTVYGVGVSVAAAPDPSAIYKLKGRASDKPVAWLVGGPEDLGRYGCDVPEWAFALARKFWPGGLTLVVRAAACVPEAFCSHAGTIGMRCPDNPTALELIRLSGAPLATSSANLSGCSPAAQADQLPASLVDAAAAVVTDALARSGVASTVVDCTGSEPIVLRQGGISLGDILEALA